MNVQTFQPANLQTDYAQRLPQHPYFAWTALALVIAVIFVYVWPHKAVTTTTGFRYFIIRWGHALTWLFLAISFALRGIGPDINGGSSFFGLAGGVMYLLFMLMTFVVK